MMLISRRTALTTLSGLPLVALTSSICPASSEIETPQLTPVRTEGGRQMNAFVSLPERLPAPAVLTIHGSLGLTDWYMAQATALAREGFVALAVDLFSGRVAHDLDGEQRLIDAAASDPAGTTAALADWVDWLRSDPRANGKVGIVGWSFGAWWALSGSIAGAADATVLFYGLQYGGSAATGGKTAELARLKGPLLAHFGELDSSIGREQIDQFERDLKALGKSAEIDWYSADHGFANPTLDGYDHKAASMAWRRTIEFLHASLASSPIVTEAAHVER
jgi:carboxymethylenebutenolidase